MSTRANKYNEEEYDPSQDVLRGESIEDAVLRAISAQENANRADAVIVGFALPGHTGVFNCVVCNATNLPTEIYTALTMMAGALSGVDGAEVGNVNVLGGWQDGAVSDRLPEMEKKGD